MRGQGSCLECRLLGRIESVGRRSLFEAARLAYKDICIGFGTLRL